MLAEFEQYWHGTDKTAEGTPRDIAQRAWLAGRRAVLCRLQILIDTEYSYNYCPKCTPGSDRRCAQCGRLL